MIKSKELLGPSCLASAADDEPIFVLKSTDELAPGVVREWAYQYRGTKRAQPGGMTEKQTAKFQEALTLATQMEEWRSMDRDSNNK
jgi:hypothetical protein